MQDLPVQGNPVQVNAFVVKQKIPGKRGFWGGIWPDEYRADARCERAQTGAFLAVTEAVWGDGVEWGRVQLLYGE